MSKTVTLVLTLVLAAMVLMIACRQENFVGPTPHFLAGDYSGYITLREGYQNTVSQSIDWRFRESTFAMSLKGDEASREFCDVEGAYVLQNNRFELNVDTTWIPDYQVCDDFRFPGGVFVIDRSTDSLRLTCYQPEPDRAWSISLIREISCLTFPDLNRSDISHLEKAVWAIWSVLSCP